MLGTVQDHVAECGAQVRALITGIARGSEPAWRRDVTFLLTRAQELAAAFPEIPVMGTGIHGDVNPGNIIKANDRWVLLDWECSRRASLTHDLFNFASWLAVFQNDYACTTEALRGDGAVAALLTSGKCAGRYGSSFEVMRVHALAYVVEKLLLQLTTGSRDDRLLERRMRRWSKYWLWLLDAITSNRALHSALPT